MPTRCESIESNRYGYISCDIVTDGLDTKSTRTDIFLTGLFLGFLKPEVSVTKEGRDEDLFRLLPSNMFQRVRTFYRSSEPSLPTIRCRGLQYATADTCASLVTSTLSEMLQIFVEKRWKSPHEDPLCNFMYHVTGTDDGGTAGEGWILPEHFQRWFAATFAAIYVGRSEWEDRRPSLRLYFKIRDTGRGTGIVFWQTFASLLGHILLSARGNIQTEYLY